MRFTKGRATVPVVLLVTFLGSPLAAQSRGDLTRGRPSDARAEETSGWKPPKTAPQSAPFLRQLGRDFERLFTSPNTLVVVGVGLGGSALSVPADTSIAGSRFNSELYEDTTLDHAFEPGRILGNGLVQVGGAATVFALGHATGKPGMTAVGSDLLRAQMITQTLTQAVKFSAGRLRPDGTNRRSFPSGHAAGAFATATVLQRHFGWKTGSLAYGVAGYVAASRLNENKHYLSDVIFGASLGILAGRTVRFNVGQGRFAMEPSVNRGGVGVQFTLVPER